MYPTKDRALALSCWREQQNKLFTRKQFRFVEQVLQLLTCCSCSTVAIRNSPQRQNNTVHYRRDQLSFSISVLNALVRLSLDIGGLLGHRNRVAGQTLVVVFVLAEKLDIRQQVSSLPPHSPPLSHLPTEQWLSCMKAYLWSKQQEFYH